MTKYTKQIGMIISLMTCTSLPLIAQEVKGRVMDEAQQPVEVIYQFRTQIPTCGKKLIISMQEPRNPLTISYPCLYR